MSFGTKTSMWWGTVKGNTERFFGKEQKRMVTHEYYDNPNPPSQRPKSMHTIASQSRRSMGSSAPRSEGKSNRDASTSSRKSSSKRDHEESARYDEQDAMNEKTAGAYQGVPNVGGAYAEEVPDMAGNNYQQQQQWDGGYSGAQDPNMMAFQQPNMMYPQDPNMMGYDPQGMMYGAQDPNMMFQPQPGMFTQDQSMFPQQPQGAGMYPDQQQYA